MAGIRIGTLYTENRDLVEALSQLGAFHGISGPTQHKVAQLLQDRGTDPKLVLLQTQKNKQPLLVKIQSKCLSVLVHSERFVWLSFINSNYIECRLFNNSNTCFLAFSLPPRDIVPQHVVLPHKDLQHLIYTLPIVNSHSPVLEWVEEFLTENRCRLKAAYSFLTGELQSMGVPYLDRPAALYVWADLRKVQRSRSH